jgi:hypothetical protein
VFWGLGARRWRTNDRNGSRGFLQCRCAQEIGLGGSSASSTRQGGEQRCRQSSGAGSATVSVALSEKASKRARDGSRTMRRRVEVILVGGGAAAAVERRPEAEQGHVREEEEERGEVRRTCLRFLKSSRTSR